MHPGIHRQPFARTPGEEFRHLQVVELLDRLFNHQIVDTNQDIRAKTELINRQKNAVHADAKIICQLGEISVFQGRSIAHHKTTLTLVSILEGCQAAFGFSTPGVPVCCWQLR